MRRLDDRLGRLPRRPPKHSSRPSQAAPAARSEGAGAASWRALGGRWAAEVVHRIVYRTHGIIRPVTYETKCGLSLQHATLADVLTDYDSEVTCPECNRPEAKEPMRR